MRRRGSRLTVATGLLALLLFTPSAAAGEPAARTIATGGDRGTAEVRISTRGAEPQARATASATLSVTILDFLFEPRDITVGIGDTVSWTNEGEKRHDVTADGFESETLETGEGYSFTFTESGTFDYLCGIHPKMKATVTVAGASSGPQPPGGEENGGGAGPTDRGSESAGRQSAGDGSGEDKGEEKSGGVSSGGADSGGGGSDGSLPSTGQDLLPAIILAELLLITGLALRLRRT